MQQANQSSIRRYVLAGDQIVQRDVIRVSSNVYVDHEFDRDERRCFRAECEQSSVPGIQLKWAFPVLLLALVIVLGMMLSKISLTGTLKQEYAQLRKRSVAAEAERQLLALDLEEKMDASDICYYAVQSLGMRRATNEETIGVTAMGAQAEMPTQRASYYSANGHQ